VKCRLFLVLAFSIVLGCEPWIGEPDVAKGVYYLENLTTDRLVVEAQSHWGDPMVLTNREVEAGETTETYSRLNDTSLWPSNTCGQLSVHRETVSEETLVYSGVNDSDWTLQSGQTDGNGASASYTRYPLMRLRTPSPGYLTTTSGRIRSLREVAHQRSHHQSHDHDQGKSHDHRSRLQYL
jgi:hypothetical protein